MLFTRRRFLGGTGAGLVLSPLVALQARIAAGAPRRTLGFGPLTPRLPVNAHELTHTIVGDLRREPILALPRGFDYRVLSMTGQPMSDGSRVPAGHDGMAAFAGPGGTTLVVRNHEIATLPYFYDFPVVGQPRYSEGALGGTTTLVVAPTRELVRDFVSLAGTRINCAGGPTPWGSWLSCEETFATTASGAQTMRHGYLFEVPAAAGGIVTPTPLTAMGRFSHEAAAVDPATGFVYLTEDRADSCFYRFVPSTAGHLAGGGRLYALRIAGGLQNATNNPHHGGTSGAIGVGQPLAVDWVEIDHADPDAEEVASPTTPSHRTAVRYQAQRKGAAIFLRGEGAWHGNQRVYFVATQGGPPAVHNLPSPPGSGRGNGQVWAYDPRAETLTLAVEASPDGGLLEEPDNVTVTPFGDLFLCEDSSDDFQHIVGVNVRGEIYPFASNVLFANPTSDPARAGFAGHEFAGACFAPAGRTLFVNIQTPGMTLAIWGPWARRVAPKALPS